MKAYLLKRKAKKYYKEYFRILDSMSCGGSLGEHISVDLFDAKQKFNDCMDKLAKIDPLTPKARIGQ